MLTAAGLSDTSRPGTINPFVTKPPHHAFGGVSFTLSYFVAQSGAVQPQLRAFINLTTWGRQLTSSSQLSMWYYNNLQASWIHCAGESHFSPATMQYNPFLTACVSGWPRDAVRQFAMFVDESSTPFASVEGAIASTLGNAIVQNPTLRTLSDPGLTAAVHSLNEHVYDAIPQVLGLFAKRRNETHFTSERTLQFVGDNISLTVAVARIGQLQGQTYEAFSASSTEKVEVALPRANDWVYSGSALADLTLGIVLMENPVLDEDALVAEQLYSNRVVTVLLQELSAAHTSASVPVAINTSSFVNVSFTERSALAYPVGGVSRQCVVLDDTLFGQFVEDTTVVTYAGSPFAVQTQCGFRTSRTVAYRQLIPTTTTTVSTTTTTQSETINTAAPTMSTSTYVSTENQDAVVFLQQQSVKVTASDAKHLSWIVVYIVFLVLTFVAFFERKRYIQKYVDYERNISDAGLVSRIPMATERDLLTDPIKGCFKQLCCLRCPVILARLCVVRHALSAMLCFRCQCCSTTVYPDRMSRIAYVVLVVFLGMGICATFPLLDDTDDYHLPRSWVDDVVGALGISIASHDQRTRVIDGNETTVYVTTMERTIVNTRIVVNGLADGVWACVFMLPFIFLTSYALNKRSAYVDVIRILAPIRYRATHPAAFKLMKLRGIPVQYWVDRARGEDTDVVVTKTEIRVQPKGDVVVRGFGGVSNSTARAISSKPPDSGRSAFTPSDFFESGYLAIDPNPDDAADDAVPRTSTRVLN